MGERERREGSRRHQPIMRDECEMMVERDNETENRQVYMISAAFIYRN
jgi:hypothetical protein|tara:strand:+ start:38969 stop:39112 length:144 start_codon:yes stop_codon:yes gene_type:complete